MLNQISVTFEGDHVLVRTSGDKDYEYLEQLWSNVEQTCEKHSCFDVIGISDTSKPLEAVEGYEIPGIFREHKIDNRYRIAWVEKNPDAVDMVEFIVSILDNRDLPGRLFDSEEEAYDWLLGKNEAE